MAVHCTVRTYGYYATEITQFEFITPFNSLRSSYVKGDDGLSSYMVFNSGDFCINHFIFNLFSFIFSCNFFASIINCSHIIPILKDHKLAHNLISNLRPISISNFFAQLFEKIMLFKMPSLLTMHPNQFGFKPKTSCTHALVALKETIVSYIDIDRKKSCYFNTLDAEKAFDKILRLGLFFKLKQNFPIGIVILLKKFYSL